MMIYNIYKNIRDLLIIIDNKKGSTKFVFRNLFESSQIVYELFESFNLFKNNDFS